jgi:phosphoglycolate phosphatase
VKLEPPRALLFDWDNTLVDTWSVIHHALMATLKAMGHRPWSFEETRIRVRASARDSFPLLFGERAERAMEIFYDTFEADHLAKLRALPGAGDMLARLAEAGILLGVVSNKRGYLLRREAAHLGWTSLFHRLVGASDAPHDKPAVEAVDLALEGSGLTKGSAVWFVGDTDIDMLCAQRARCLPVLLRADPPAPEEFVEAAPRCHVTSCEALAELATAY